MTAQYAKPLDLIVALVAICIPMATVRAAPPVTEFALDNGLRVAVIEDHRAPVVTHMVWYQVGAANPSS